MKLKILLFAIFLKILNVDNKMLQLVYNTGSKLPCKAEAEELPPSVEQETKDSHEEVLGLKSFDDRDSDEYFYGSEKRNHWLRTKKPCSVVVLSNVQHPSMQSLLRKYRYNANGVLIPSSVKYFMKLPREFHSSPLLVPLNDQAFSPSGGFVRYYKEVPPIPQSYEIR